MTPPPAKKTKEVNGDHGDDWHLPGVMTAKIRSWRNWGKIFSGDTLMPRQCNSPRRTLPAAYGKPHCQKA